MSLGITHTLIVDPVGNGAGATDTADVDGPQNFHVHRFWISFTAACTVQIQTSTNGTDFFDMLDTAVTTSGAIKEVDRPWRFMRVSWSGNTGALTVTVEQIYSRHGATV